MHLLLCGHFYSILAEGWLGWGGGWLGRWLRGYAWAPESAGVPAACLEETEHRGKEQDDHPRAASHPPAARFQTPTKARVKDKSQSADGEGWGGGGGATLRSTSTNNNRLPRGKLEHGEINVLLRTR